MPDLSRREFLARTGALAAAAALPSVPVAKAAAEAKTPALGSGGSIVCDAPSGFRLYTRFYRDDEFLGLSEGTELTPGRYSFPIPAALFRNPSQVSVTWCCGSEKEESCSAI